MPDVTTLDASVGREASSELQDFLEDEKASDAVGEVVCRTEAAWLARAAGRLPEPAKQVLVRRYGLDGDDSASLADLSKELGLSQERLRKLQSYAERTLGERYRRGDAPPSSACEHALTQPPR